MGELKIRPFVPVQDDELVADITTRARSGTPDFVPPTVAEMRLDRQSPWSSEEGLLIAELDGTPVAVVNAFVDKTSLRKQGYVDELAVVPEARRRGIGSALLVKAVESFRGRGMEKARCGAHDWNEPAAAFLRRHGFPYIRTFSRMERDLATLPEGIGENRDVELKTISLDDEDIKSYHAMSNAIFAEHYNFEPSTLEDFAYGVRHAQDYGIEVERYCAWDGDIRAGYVICSVDPAENEKLGTRRGWVSHIGVLKEHRDKGIAKRLLVHAFERLRAMGMESAHLGVDTGNLTHALRLYERVGFHVVRQYHHYELNLAAPA